MSLRIEKTHPEIGARVWGVDLSRPIDAEVAAAMRKAFDDNIMLVFPDQELGEQEQLRAAEVFGRVAWRKKPIVGDGPGGNFDTPFMLVTNIVENGKPIGAFGDGEMWFHHDTSYYPEPHRATLLYAMKLTTWGGQTCFSNMYRAYDMIPRSLRDKLEGRRVLQMHDYKRRERLNLDTSDLSKIRHNWQPLFVTHPATGKKALYISRLMSSQIEGLSHAESEDALGAAMQGYLGSFVGGGAPTALRSPRATRPATDARRTATATSSTTTQTGSVPRRHPFRQSLRIRQSPEPRVSGQP
jgi:taurine dioxygenase